MKKKYLYLFLLTVILFIFNSCKPITTTSIFAVPEVELVEPGDTAIFNIILMPDALNGGKLDKVEILDIDSNILQAHFLSGSVSDSIKFEYIVPPQTAIGTVFTFIICAYNDVSAKTYLNITVNVNFLVPPIITSKNVHTFFSGMSLNDTMLICLDADGIKRFNADTNLADLAFVFDPTFGYSIVSPNSEWIADIYSVNDIEYDISDKSETKIQLSDSAWTYFDKNTIDNITVEGSILQGGSGIGVQNLKEDDILIFETLDGRKGAMKINVMTKTDVFLISDIKYQN